MGVQRPYNLIIQFLDILTDRDQIFRRLYDAYNVKGIVKYKEHGIWFA